MFKKTFWLKILFFFILLFTIINFHKIKFVFSIFSVYLNNEKINETLVKTETNPFTDIIEKNNDSNPSEIEDDYISTEDDISYKKDTENVNTKKHNNANKLEKNNLHNINTDKEDNTSLINIVILYNDKFENLQQEYLTSLDILVSKAEEEHKKGNLSTSELASKYIDKGSSLEKECDEKFYSFLKEMEKELKENGHNTTLSKDAKEYYISFKKAKKNELLNKAKKYM